jgi:hypothetical protein
MRRAANDHWVNGGPTPPTSAVATTMSVGKRLASRERRYVTKEWGMTMHGRRHTLWVRLATRRGDVVRLVKLKGKSVGMSSIPEMRVRWGVVRGLGWTV